MSSSINQPIHLNLPSIASPSVHIASCLVFSDVQNDFYAALLCNVGAFFLSCFPSFSLLICHPSNSFQPLCLSSNCFAHILSLLISFFLFSVTSHSLSISFFLNAEFYIIITAFGIPFFLFKQATPTKLYPKPLPMYNVYRIFELFV